jgi:serine-type D-Ala-D-Ala carboxypeptidase (penicillin-binding protein 5/6)
VPPRSRPFLLLTLLAGLLTGLLSGPLSGPPWTPGATAAPPAAPGGPGGQAIGGPLLATRGVLVGRGAPALPRDVTGRAWLVADLDTGAVLGARDPHGRYLPASTLKTLTALTLLPRLTDRNRVIRATAEDCNVDGTRVGLVPNGRYRVEMLFQCLLMMSGNDCAGALAAANGGMAWTPTPQPRPGWTAPARPPRPTTWR